MVIVKQNTQRCTNQQTYIRGRGYVEGSGFDIHSLIGKLPRPKKGWTLPNHKYTGPWNL